MSAVAVVIPLYNKADTVARTIESVRAQSIKDIEIVVIDDGSTDGGASVVGAAFDGDPRCEYIYQENAGVAHARNNGVLNHTTAPFVVCLDSDDAIEPDYLELLLGALVNDRQVAIAYTALRFVTPNGETGVSKWPGEFDADKQMKGQNQIPTAAMTRRQVWERLGGQRQRYAPLGAGAEDGDFWLRAVSYGFDAKYVQPHTGSFFVYSWQSGIVSGNKDYREVDYRKWSPWTTNYSLMPSASLATPLLFSHGARQYDEPTVSVIIPVGPGHARHLVNCLDSLDAQTFKRWEAIVVFDVGTEEYNELLDSGQLNYIAQAWPFCRFMTSASTATARESVDFLDVCEHGLNLLASLQPASEPRGAGRARNVGIERARGPLLMFLDADDWLVPEALDKMVSMYKMTGKIIYSDHIAIASIPEDKLDQVDGHVVGYNHRTGEAYINQRVADYDCKRALEQPYTDGRPPYVICNVSSIVPKKWVVELGGFSEKINSWEDVLLFWQLAWGGKCFTRLAEPLLVYRYTTGGRRELGRKNAKVLLKYLSDLSKETEKMGCGCTGQAGPGVVINAASSGGAEMISLGLSRGGTLQVADIDVVLAEFNPPDRGDKMRYGLHQWPGGLVKYGHFSGGEVFYVHEKDIAADLVLASAQGRAPMFTPVQVQVDGIVEEPEEVIELEPPSEITELFEIAPDDVGELDMGLFFGEEGVLESKSSKDYFPEPLEKQPDLPPGFGLVDLELKGIKNPDRYIGILIANDIRTPEDIIEFEKENEHLEGISVFKGIGPKVREEFVSASRKALGI